MSTTGMVNLQNAPRDKESLLQIKRGIRYRLGLQIQMFKDNTEEGAFLSASDEEQAQALSEGLQRYDANGGQVSAALPQAPAIPTAPTPAMPQQPPQPQMPMTIPVVGNQPVMPPAAVRQPPQPIPQQMSLPTPQMPQMPQMPSPPQMMSQQAAPPPPQPQSVPPLMPAVQPAVPQAPPPQPVTAADPNNKGIDLAATIPKQLAGIIKAIKAISEVNENTQAWIEEVHEHALGTSRVLATVVLMQLVLAEQTGFSPDVLMKLMLAKPDNTVENFLKHFITEEEEDDEGKE